MGFNADLDPAFYLNPDPHPDPDQTFKSQKVEFDKKNIPDAGDRSKTYLHTFSKGRKPGLFVNFDQFPCSWIRIRIPNMYPNPGQPNQY